MNYLKLITRTIAVACILGTIWFYGYVTGRGDAPRPIVIYVGGIK